jgi:hypothetical protein
MDDLQQTTQEPTMADKQTAQHADESNTIKDPDTWTTGDEPMTGAQRSYLHTLATGGVLGGRAPAGRPAARRFARLGVAAMHPAR